MGSYWASHIAAYDDRIKACVAAIGCFMMNRHSIFEEASPRFRLIYKYMAGIEDDDEFDEKIVSRMTLKGAASGIKCPTLIWVGEFDPLSSLEETDAFFNEVAGPKEMWIFGDDFHTTFNRGLCNVPMSNLAADWLRDRFDGKPLKHAAGRLFIPVNGTGPYMA